MTDNLSNSAAAVKDPVCGMTVNPATAKHRLEHAGKSYYFCCSHFTEKFKANPQQSLTQPTPSRLVTLGAPAVHPAPAKQATYVCRMCPKVRQSQPGPCPTCGMALEPETPLAATHTEYTCPMHPEIVRPGPGACPICGMALEPRTVTAKEEDNPELREMTRRLWISVLLTAPLLGIAMTDMLPGMPIERALPRGWLPWVEFALSTPVVLWGGWPFFQRGWASVVNRSTNMFTLIAMGTGVAYVFSAVATLFPRIFPASFRTMGDHPDVYFEAAAAIVTLVLLGQVLELRARSRTSSAIRALLDLSPKKARLLSPDSTDDDSD